MRTLETRFMRSAICLIFLCLFLTVSVEAAENTLEIRNSSERDILNIYAQPLKGSAFFMRLDLSPGAADTVANPAVTAALRVDTGLEFLFFDNVPLGDARELVFCGEHPACLEVAFADGSKEHMAARVENLVPREGEKPVCELERFVPDMPMSEVCAILPGDLPRDDNGSILTGLGFSGGLWAARLFPYQNENAGKDAILEHLELRQNLSKEAIGHLLKALYERGNIPWQAEFPGVNMDFSDRANENMANAKETLDEAIARFVASRKQPANSDNSADEEDEARILVAPAEALPVLAAGGAPAADLQLFTITIRPASKTLMLDVSAWKARKPATAETF